jgi:RHS repeat-associated protein
VTYPNGLESQFTPDTLNRVTSLNNGKLIYDYTLDAAGNRRQVIEHLPNETGRTVNWSYDNIYRLTDEVITLDPHSKNGNAHYDLDPVGNRTQETATLPGLLPGTFTYDADDRLNTETYDANGNTLTSGGKTFNYDFENRLKSMTAGSVTVTLAYDADGNRVAKTVNGVTTRYLVDDLNPTGYSQVVEEVTNGAVTRQYTYGLQRIGQTQQVANAWTPAFYGYDGAGTVRLLTDSTGTVTDTYDYDAWGNAVNTTGSTPNVYLYRGEQYDSDLGLYYLRARYLNPLSGRFLTRDPEAGHIKVPVSLHKYVYAGANPVNITDPSGRKLGFSEWVWIVGTVSFFVAHEMMENALELAEIGRKLRAKLNPGWWESEAGGPSGGGDHGEYGPSDWEIMQWGQDFEEMDNY